jgi:hypothetical protein
VSRTIERESATTVSDSTQPRRKRPHSVTAIAWLFIAAGVLGFGHHVTELDLRQPFADGVLWTLIVRLLALVAGVFMLRGADWARWLALAWLAFHVLLGAAHSVSNAVIHAILLGAIAFALLRPSTTAWFRQRGDST